MRVVLVTFAYLPDSVGGTEIYVAALAREFRVAGHDVRVVVASNDRDESRTHDGVPIEIATSARFALLLEHWKVDVVHFHPLTADRLLLWMKAARRCGVMTVCTYHTPTLTCSRGDLLLRGSGVCDGRMDIDRCSTCVMHAKGLPGPLAPFVLAVSPTQEVGRRLVPRKVRSLLSIAASQSRAMKAWEEVCQCIDQWVATARWVAKVLEINGVDPARISVSRQGLPASTAAPVRPVRGSGKLKVGYLGRIHPYKGIAVLIDALESVPRAPIKLAIFGGGAPDYENALRRRAARDPRIEWRGSLHPQEVAGALSEIDLLAVPSLWLETGPMTILEGWSAGVSFIGSRRGGIEEWQLEYGGGVLFAPGNAGELGAILEAIAAGSIPLVPAPLQVRTMNEVSVEMTLLYSRPAAHVDA